MENYKKSIAFMKVPSATTSKTEKENCQWRMVRNTLAFSAKIKEMVMVVSTMLLEK